MPSDDYVEYEGRIVGSTDKAVLFYIEDLDEEVWFPLSQVELSSDNTSILIPLWLVNEKGL